MVEPVFLNPYHRAGTKAFIKESNRMRKLLKNALRSRAFRSFVATIEQKVPLLRAWHRFEYEQHFTTLSSTNTRLFSGLYRTAEAALAAVPKGLRVGHNHPEVADRHASEPNHLWPSDYPVLFWLKSILEANATVDDIGGGASGMTFHGFRKYIVYPDSLNWIVCEVPAVAKLGVELARLRKTEGLGFTTRIEDAEVVKSCWRPGQFGFWKHLFDLRLVNSVANRNTS